MKTTILAIAGRPGLYKLLTHANARLIVEALDETHRRFPAFERDRITSLADIVMYTEGEDKPLMEVMANLREKEQGGKVSIAYKKCPTSELHDYFAQVLHEYDRDRVHDSDIRKLLQWYDILVANGITDFEDDLQPTEGDNIKDREEKKAEAE